MIFMDARFYRYEIEGWGSSSNAITTKFHFSPRRRFLIRASGLLAGRTMYARTYEWLQPLHDAVGLRRRRLADALLTLPLYFRYRSSRALLWGRGARRPADAGLISALLCSWALIGRFTPRCFQNTGLSLRCQSLSA